MPQLCAVFAAAPIPQGHDSCAPAAVAIQKIGKRPPIFPPRKRKNIFLPFFAHLCVSLLPRCSAHKLFMRAARGPSAAGPSPAPRRFLRPSHKQKNAGPRHCAANPQKRRLLAQENARRHAWLSRSCFGRKNLFIDGPHSLLPFFLSPFLQRKRKRKQKQIQQVRIHRSDSLRSSSRCTRLAPRLVR